MRGYLGPRLPREVQLKRVQRVMQEELTPLQRETLIAFYFQEQTLTQIAADRGVNKSTVCRTETGGGQAQAVSEILGRDASFWKTTGAVLRRAVRLRLLRPNRITAENPAKIDSPAGRIPGRAAVSPFYRRGRPGTRG